MSKDEIILSEKELEEIQAQAELEAEEEIKDELKTEALNKAKASIKAKRSAKEASEAKKAGTRMVFISLGNHCDRITVNGRIFMHGRSYALTLDEERSILDTAFRTHLHQAEKKGGKWLSDFYGRQQSRATV